MRHATANASVTGMLRFSAVCIHSMAIGSSSRAVRNGPASIASNPKSETSTSGFRAASSPATDIAARGGAEEPTCTLLPNPVWFSVLNTAASCVSAATGSPARGAVPNLQLQPVRPHRQRVCAVDQHPTAQIAGGCQHLGHCRAGHGERDYRCAMRRRGNIDILSARYARLWHGTGVAQRDTVADTQRAGR
jgi:hypothetical protein